MSKTVSNENPQDSSISWSDGQFDFRHTGTDEHMMPSLSQLTVQAPLVNDRTDYECHDYNQIRARMQDYKSVGVEYISDKVFTFLDTQVTAAEEANRGYKFPRLRRMPSYFISRLLDWQSSCRMSTRNIKHMPRSHTYSRVKCFPVPMSFVIERVRLNIVARL